MMRHRLLFTLQLLLAANLAIAAPKFGESLPIAESYFPPYLQESLKDVRTGNCESAINKLERELRIRNSSKADHRSREAAAHKILLLKAVSELDCDKPQEANQTVLAALELSPSNSYLHYLNGVSAWRLQRKDLARKAFDEALWFAKKDWVASDDLNFRIALIELEAGDKAAAEKRLNAALADNSKHLPSMLQIADLLAGKGDRAAAIKQLRSARSADGTNPAPKLQLAKLLISDNPATLSEKEMHEALDMAVEVKNSPAPPPNSPWDEDTLKRDAIFTEIKALLLLKENEKAASALEQANAAYKNDPELPRMTKQLEIEKTITSEQAPKDSASQEGESN